MAYQLAVVLDRDGDVDDAVKAYQRFLELNDDAEQAGIVREHIAELKGKDR